MTSEPGTPARPRRLAARAPQGPIPAQREAYAGLVSRLLALVVDAMLLALAVPAIGAGAPAVWASIAGSAPRWLYISAGVLAGVLPFTYFWLCWSTWGRTVGGALLGAEVCRADGSRLGMMRAAARALLGLLFAPIWLAFMLLIAFDSRRRALHDMLLRTVVRRTEV